MIIRTSARVMQRRIIIVSLISLTVTFLGLVWFWMIAHGAVA